MTLDIIQAAMRQLEASGQPVSANTLVALVGGSKRDVLALLRQARALAGVTTGPVQPDDEDDDAAPDAPSAPHEEEPEDPTRRALAEKIAQLQAELAALPPPPPLYPVTPELVSFQRAYRAAMAATPADIYNDRVVMERAACQYDFHQRCELVRRLLTRARRLSRRPRPYMDIDDGGDKVLAGDMKEIEKFCGRAEAERLVGNNEQPVWRLEG